MQVARQERQTTGTTENEGTEDLKNLKKVLDKAGTEWYNNPRRKKREACTL